jgi:F0F1-type ATP synthase beta subunit
MKSNQIDVVGIKTRELLPPGQSSGRIHFHGGAPSGDTVAELYRLGYRGSISWEFCGMSTIASIENLMHGVAG